MELSEGELFLAYRQAKNALAEERFGLGRLDMAAAERALPAAIRSLRLHLAGSPGWFSGLSLGKLWLVPKKPRAVPNRTGIARIGGEYRVRLAEMSVRTHLVPSLQFAIVELLWLREFGAALETLLTPAARGNRLKLRGRGREFDRDTRLCFQFWPKAYQSFRAEGFAVARRMLTRRSGRCLVATFDLASYYDEIDPEFLLSMSFRRDLVARAAAQAVALDEAEYVRATRTLLAAFARYRTLCKQLTGVSVKRGIPIGALTSKVIANIALTSLDAHIQAQPGVRYYARYVDDMLLVADRPPRMVATPRSIAAAFLPLKPATDGRRKHSEMILDSDKLGRPGSRFRIQPSKLRGYLLQGRRGKDFLDTVERDVRIIASERRAFLDPDGLGSASPLAALFVGSDSEAPVQALRDVDRLKVERYAASVAISKVAVGVELLDPAEAERWCRRQLAPLVGNITNPEESFHFLDLAFRALSVCIRANDMATARTILRRHAARLARFQSRPPASGVLWNGRVLRWRTAKARLTSWYEHRRFEEICASIRLSDLQPDGTAQLLKKLLSRPLTVGRRIYGPKAILSAAQVLVAADLRAIDRETDLQTADAPAPQRLVEGWKRLGQVVRRDPRSAAHYSAAETFSGVCQDLRDRIYQGIPPLKLLLMTRPPTQFDIANRWARAGRPAGELPGVTNGIRGTRYADTVVRSIGKHEIDVSRVDWFGSPETDDIRVVLGNLTTTDEWWAAAAKGVPTVTKDRMMGIGRIVNEAIRLKNRTKNHTILILPELSLPAVLTRALAGRLLGEDISLVAGIEYRRKGKKVANEAIGVFAAGYWGVAVCWWPKSLPARLELALLADLKLGFVEHRNLPFVVHTDFGSVSTLICSELLDVRRRSKLLGRVDMLVVPAWNQDTATFDHTVQTTANDLHCFVAVANNAQFSDSRVQVPHDKRFLRDALRVVCRYDDMASSVVLSAQALREFQRNSLKTPTKKFDGFKPLPPGYEFKRP